MNISLQRFFFVLLACLALVFIVVWSFSLYLLLGDHSDVLRDNPDFISVWSQQAIWMLPMLLLLVVLLYVIFTRVVTAPLLRLSRRIHDVVVTRDPNNAMSAEQLQPGFRQLDKYFSQLIHQTTHDPLTGLNNRVMFEERLKQVMLEGRRSGRRYALVFIDIDNFQRVNHEFGHYVADGLLRQLSQRLINGLRESDILARLEKDDFALLLEFVDDDQISSLIGKIYQYLTRSYSVYERTVKISLSIGVAIYPEHGQDMDELSIKADEALIQAQKGESPVVFVQQAEDQTDFTGFTRIQTVRRALDRDEFKLVYQPVMEMKRHKTSYFEALLRWKQPESHDLTIQHTIHVAEKNQMIKPLTNWIIDNVCKHLQALNHPGVRMAVNLSMIDLHDEELPGRIEQSLARWRVKPADLQVEITEGQIMQEPEQVIRILTRLTSMGISLSIDDFGTGQASLTYLRRLPVEKLKIDQSFVKDMVSNADDRAIVEATIQLAHTLGIEVVAEGVESAAIHDLLADMGCDYVQGYYISHPIDQDQIPNWCDAQAARVVS